MSQGDNRKREFLLTFFDSNHRYEAKEVNGFMLVRFWDGGMKRWTVGIFTKESYHRMNEEKKPQTESLF